MFRKTCFKKFATLWARTPFLMLTISVTVFVFIFFIIFLIWGNENIGVSFVTQDTNTIRYLLSTVFQGIAALFGLMISMAFLVTQLLSTNYSGRMVFSLTKKWWFLLGISAFVVSLVVNAFLLAFVEDNSMAKMHPFIIFDCFLTIALIIYVIPFTALFIRGIHPMKIAREVLDQLNKNFFEKLDGSNAEIVPPASISLLQAILIRNIEHGDDDISKRILNSLSYEIKKSISDDNYELMSKFFYPLYKKAILLSSKSREEEVLESIAYQIENIHEDFLPKNFMKRSWMEEESLLHLILLVAQESLKNGLVKPCRTAIFGVIARIEEKYILSIPEDDEISDFRLTKFLRTRSGLSENKPVHYANHTHFQFVEHFLISGIFNLTVVAINQRDEQMAGGLIGAMLRIKYPIFKLDEKHEEVKKRLIYSILFKINNLIKIGEREKINVFDDIVNRIQEIGDDLDSLDEHVSAYSVQLMLNALVIMIDKDLFGVSPDFTLNMAGARIRGMIQNKTGKALIGVAISTFEQLTTAISRKNEESIDPMLNKTKNEIAVQLDSFQQWGLNDIDQGLYTRVGLFLESNWPPSEIEAIRAKKT